MGYSVLSMAMGMRYTQWVRHEHGVPDFDKHMAPPELYVHHNDPHENDNVAADPTYANDCAALSHKLKHNFGHATAGWHVTDDTIQSVTNELWSPHDDPQKGTDDDYDASAVPNMTP